MAIATRKRRVVTTIMETTRGTFVAPNPTNDALPTVGEAQIEAFEPLAIDRSILRQSFTRYPDIYPGVATATISYIVELGGNTANPQTDYATPNWADCFRSCGFTEVSNAAGGLKPRLLRNVTSLTGGVADTPLRHGETVTGNGTAPAGTGVVVGDFFAEDDVLTVQETAAPGGTLTTWTGATSGRIATGNRGANAVVAFRLSSNVNTTETTSQELYLDGKVLQLKGCMGNAEILLDFGNTLRAKFTMQGIVNIVGGVQQYIDAPLPSTPYELHKVAPTFLGKDVRIYEIGATPKFYGRDSAAGTPVVGSISQIRLNTGNQVIARRNAFDAVGITNCLITDRSPTGSFDPDEVLNSEFNWIAKFIAGTPMRFKAMVGAVGTTLTQDGNTCDFLAPGIVISQMGDGDRDGINAWNGQFKITGGDYDPSAAGELPGNDSEFTIIHR